MYDISGHLFSISQYLGFFFNPGVPNEEFIKTWLRGYHEETNGTEELIENEYKKVLANMLLIRLWVIKIAYEFTMKLTGQIPFELGINYAVKVYKDYKENLDKHLLLLDTLKKFKQSVTCKKSM